MPRPAIEAYASRIQVPYLVHFTRAINLPSIMTHGIYPIGLAHKIGAAPAINDHHRFDGRRNSTSVSIGFPNSKMFYRCRMDNPAVDWVVLILYSAVLWSKDCAFCRHNAADARISAQPLPQLTTPQAFVAMYDEIEGVATRGEQNLKSYDPTDVQAEVLVFDVIEPQYIAGAVFETSAVRDEYLPHLGQRKAYVHANSKGIFASRTYARKYDN